MSPPWGRNKTTDYQGTERGHWDSADRNKTGWHCDSEWIQDKTGDRQKWDSLPWDRNKGDYQGAETRQLTTKGWKEDTETQQIGTRQADTVIVSGYKTDWRPAEMRQPAMGQKHVWLPRGRNKTDYQGTKTRHADGRQQEDRLTSRNWALQVDWNKDWQQTRNTTGWQQIQSALKCTGSSGQFWLRTV